MLSYSAAFQQGDDVVFGTGLVHLGGGIVGVPAKNIDAPGDRGPVETVGGLGLGDPLNHAHGDVVGTVHDEHQDGLSGEGDADGRTAAAASGAGVDAVVNLTCLLYTSDAADD